MDWILHRPIQPMIWDGQREVKDKCPKSWGGDDGELPILINEVQKAINSLQDSKATGIDNNPAELIKKGGSKMVDVLTKICKMIWEDKLWTSKRLQSLIIPILKKTGSLKCGDYRMVSLISHVSKIMLQVLLSGITPKIKCILSEEQTSFRKGRSTTEQITNLRIILEKHIQQQTLILQNYKVLKKAFDWGWHKGLWKVMSNHNVDQNMNGVITTLYQNSESAVIIMGAIG